MPYIVHISFLPAAGMAIFPLVFIKRPDLKNDQALMNHEKIHLAQQKELLILPFYLLYCLHYLLNLLWYRKHHTAYMNIVFEKEAYMMERESDYLKRRRLFAWIRFI